MHHPTVLALGTPETMQAYRDFFLAHPNLATLGWVVSVVLIVSLPLLTSLAINRFGSADDEF